MTKERSLASHLRLAKPPATAFILGLLSSTSPRLLRVLVLLGKRKVSLRAAWLQFIIIFRQALSLHRFPAFCATIMGGSTLLQLPINYLIIKTLRPFRSTSKPIYLRMVRISAKFSAALISASISFTLLNRGPSGPGTSRRIGAQQSLTNLEVIKPSPFDEPPETSSKEVDDATLKARSLSRGDLAGRTLDLTLFAVIRALDILVSSAWDRLPSSLSPPLKQVSQTAPTVLFCLSAATIMHAWFYSPSRLPKSYNAWISAAAELDHRLLLALRHARYGTWIYGKDTGMASLLGSMCHDYGLPEELGDPARTIPVPCEVVHMGRGKSCEKHALIRFWRGWLFAARMYAPLQAIVLARHMKKNARSGNKLAGLSRKILLKAFKDMVRNSAFLGAFIALFYYGVCLSRTRLGPRLISYKSVTPQMWDSGLCVLGGCLLCGASILVEQSRKRLEILFFVLPRAAAVWFPRRYLPEHQWKEHLAFSLGAAIVLTTAQESPKRVRGVLGDILHGVLKAN